MAEQFQQFKKLMKETMKLPSIFLELLIAQENFDSKAYGECFSETALVYDENETHKGLTEIIQWNEKTNKKYKTQLEVLNFVIDKNTTILTMRVKGTFDGSPIVLKYHFEVENGKINSLEITA